MHRRREALREVAARGVTQRGGEIHRVAHDRRVRGAHRDQRHLIRDRLEALRNTSSRIGSGSRRTVATLFERDDNVVVSIEAALARGGTTVVPSYSSMIKRAWQRRLKSGSWRAMTGGIDQAMLLTEVGTT